MLYYIIVLVSSCMFAHDLIFRNVWFLLPMDSQTHPGISAVWRGRYSLTACVFECVCACKMSGCLFGGVEVVRTCSHPQSPWEKHTFLCLLFKGLPESSCTGERAAHLLRLLFWFPKEIRLITPAARSQNWGRAKTSNKNLRRQEIWKATAAPDSCPSKLDCVLRPASCVVTARTNKAGSDEPVRWR